MKPIHYSDNETPTFCWDRRLTAGEIRKQLAEGSQAQRESVMAWILREAATGEVWDFVTPRQVFTSLDRIKSRLGRKAGFWYYLTGKWHELGKV